MRHHAWNGSRFLEELIIVETKGVPEHFVYLARVPLEGRRMIKAVIWDLGGCLCKDVWEHLYQDKDHGIRSICRTLPSDQELMKTGSELWNEYACRDATEAEYWQDFNRRLGQAHAPSVYIDLSERFIAEVPGMLALVAKLHARGVPMAICSNNNAFWFLRQWHKFKLYRFFSDKQVVVSFREGVTKSHPSLRMFRRAAEVLDIPEGNCLFLDDRLGNLPYALLGGLTALQMPADHTMAPQYLAALFAALGLL